MKKGSEERALFYGFLLVLCIGWIFTKCDDNKRKDKAKDLIENIEKKSPECKHELQELEWLIDDF